MKHKRILLGVSNNTNKANNSTEYNNKNVNNFLGTIIIAVAGTKHGIGCTHTAICIANYISKCGFPVALIEMNNNKDFSNMYDENFDSGKINSFQIDGVDYFAYNTYKFSDVLNAGYKYIVLDLSVLNSDNDNYIEFERSHKQILVSGINEWELKSLLIALNNNDMCTLLVNFADDDMFHDFMKSFKRNAYMLPYCPDIYKSYKEQDIVLHNILNDIMI